MSETFTIEIPELGQLAQVRSRHYVVTEVVRGSLSGMGQHLVTLQSCLAQVYQEAGRALPGL